MGYYETTLARMKTILAHMVATAQDGSNTRHLTCRSWVYSELGRPLGWSWQTTCRAIAGLIEEGWVEEATNLPPGTSVRRKWICTTAEGRKFYQTITAEDSRAASANATARHTPPTT